MRGERAPSNAAASVTAVLASQGLSPVSRRSRSRNAAQRNGASHASGASRSEVEWSGGEDTAGVWRRGGPSKGSVFCGASHNLATVGKATGEQKPPCLLGRGRAHTHTLCGLRKAVRNGVSTKWRSAGGVMAQQAQTEIEAGRTYRAGAAGL